MNLPLLRCLQSLLYLYQDEYGYSVSEIALSVQGEIDAQNVCRICGSKLPPKKNGRGKMMLYCKECTLKHKRETEVAYRFKRMSEDPDAYREYMRLAQIRSRDRKKIKHKMPT